jgi:hypothetical protein
LFLNFLFQKNAQIKNTSDHSTILHIEVSRKFEDIIMIMCFNGPKQ